MNRHSAKLDRRPFRQLSRLAVATALMLVTSVSVAVVSATAATTTAYLDTYNSSDAAGQSFCVGPTMLTTTPPGCGTTVTVPVVLASAQSYTLTVSGAVSVWGTWPFNRCGKPEPSSQFASGGITNRPAGDDAQFRFAVPLYQTKCHFKVRKASYFQVDLGSGWFHPIAGSEPTKPSGDNKSPSEQHPYTFTLIGEGVEPQFRYVDFHPSDNSGRFKLVISG